MKILLSLILLMNLPAFASLPDSTDPIVQSQNTELIEQLDPKKAIISKAVIIQDGQAVCYIDFTDKENQTDLLPSFSKPIPENFKSSISIHNLRACNGIELENYSYLKDHFILEGTQTAIIPALIPFFTGLGGSILGGGVIGCLIGNLTKGDEIPKLAFLSTYFALFFTTVATGVLTGGKARWLYYSTNYWTQGALGGGVVGVMVCNKANFNIIHFFEDIFD